MREVNLKQRIKKMNGFVRVVFLSLMIVSFGFAKSLDVQKVAHYDTSGYANSVTIQNNHIFVASGWGGLYIFH